MSTTSCERCEDFAADALKVLSQRCAPDERHCSCVPHLRAEIDRLTAERAALLAPVDGINEDLGVLANIACEDLKHNDLWCPTCEEYPTIRALAREAIRRRAELEEARLTLAAEKQRRSRMPSDNPDRLLAEVNAERIRRNLSWRDLATRLDVAPSTLTRWNNGRCPSIAVYLNAREWLTVMRAAADTYDAFK